MKKKTTKRKPSYFSLHKGMLSIIAGGLLGFVLLAPVGAQFIKTIEIPIAIRLVGITTDFGEEFDGLLGASAGTNHDFQENFNVGLFSAGLNDADNTLPALVPPNASSTLLLSANQICQNPTIDLSPATTTVFAVTLPSQPNFKSNGTCLSKRGSIQQFTVYLASSTSGGVTFTAGASSTIALANLATTTSVTGYQAATSTLYEYGLAKFTGRLVASSSDYIKWELEIFR